MNSTESVYVIEELSASSILITNGNKYAHLIYKGSGIFLLDGIYGVGAGRILLTMAIYEARKRGGILLELTAIADEEYISQDKLETFYKNFGFVYCGDRKRSGSIRMRKNLINYPLIQSAVLENILKKS